MDIGQSISKLGTGLKSAAKEPSPAVRMWSTIGSMLVVAGALWSGLADFEDKARDQVREWVDSSEIEKKLDVVGALGPQIDKLAAAVEQNSRRAERIEKAVDANTDQLATIERRVDETQHNLDALGRDVGAIKENVAISATPCFTMPKKGHSVSLGFPGDVVTVSWSQITSQRSDCGKPDLVVTVVDHEGNTKTAPTVDFEGTSLPFGEPTDLAYDVRLPETLRPGTSQLWVNLSYPNAVRGAAPLQTPIVHFTILDPSRRGDYPGLNDRS